LPIIFSPAYQPKLLLLRLSFESQSTLTSLFLIHENITVFALKKMILSRLGSDVSKRHEYCLCARVFFVGKKTEKMVPSRMEQSSREGFAKDQLD
jgi:hypothetical protein